MRRKRRLKKPVKRALIIILLLLAFSLSFLFIYKWEIRKVNSSNEEITFEVESGNNFISIADSLKEKNLIKSVFFYKLYVKLHKPSSLNAGVYELKSNMSVEEIIVKLQDKKTKSSIVLTFKEGINFNDIIKIITKETSITENDIKNLLNDENYINGLISKYWFLTDNIKNKQIYYPLEGYLFPDTYHIDKTDKADKIFEKMLDNTESKLEKYKASIENNKYNIHEIMTMASIIELEASNSNDRNGVAGVFYNRLKNNWSLGSDVTTYYGLKLSLSERDLTQEDLKSDNGYNTRSDKMLGKLPVGPICIPSIESIEAAINPTDHNYFYFVADKNGKTYFSKTPEEHTRTVNKLKKDKLWYEY